MQGYSCTSAKGPCFESDASRCFFSKALEKLFTVNFLNLLPLIINFVMCLLALFVISVVAEETVQN